MKLLVLEEKHGNRYFLIRNIKELENICTQIIAERREDCCYDEDENFLLLWKKWTGYTFLLSRNDAEYEHIELKDFENDGEKS